MEPEEKKPLNYWQKDANEAPVQHAPEQARDTPVSQPSRDERLTDDDPVNWTAAEYIHLEKGAWWFVVFAVIVLALISVDFFVFKSWTFSILVVVMAIAIVVYTKRPPREVHYALSGKQGLYVGEKLYHFEDFKAFGTIRDGDHYSIMLIPTKRFAPGVSVYFPEEAGERIVDILGTRLPMEDLKLDAIDVLVRKLRL
jgi:hypothetical protein